MTPFKPTLQTGYEQPSNFFELPVHTHTPLYPPLRFEETGAGLKAAPSNAEGLRGWKASRD
jgi:hypothetical protein